MSAALRRRYSPPSGEPAWLRALRDDALARFEEQGLPTARLEDWKYTARALRGLDLDALELAAAGPAPQVDAASLEGRIGTLADVKRDAFAALNSAFFGDVAAVRVAKGEQFGEPVVRSFAAEAGMQFPRVWIEAERASRAIVVLDFTSRGADTGVRFTNALAEVRVAPEAQLDVVVLQREDDAALHVSRCYARVERGGRLRIQTLSLGGALVRNDLEVVLAEEGAEVDLDGLFVGAGERHVDNHTLVDHAVPHTTSRELYKGVLGERSRGVFRGRVIVRPGAQKTSAEQHNPNLLLSSRAEIDTKPQLEIYADDVRCSHGSTIGQLDANALFFLRARGIARDDAFRMLVEAFAGEIVDEVEERAGAPVGAIARDALRASFAASTGAAT